MDAPVNINGISISWSDIVANINGVTLTGITKISYDDKRTKENKYGMGSFPVARGYGKYEASAKITIPMEAVRELTNSVPTRRIQDVPMFDLVVSYMPEDSNKVHTDILKNCEFTSNGRAWLGGDKPSTAQDVDFTLILSHIEWG